VAEDKVTQALKMREGSNVERCHTTPHFGQYSVGKHSFGMLLLLEILHSKPTRALYRAIMMHDLSERYVGDTPGSVNRIDPDFKAAHNRACELMDEVLEYAVELTDEERSWVKALDKIELWLWCHDQLNMGNDHVGTIVDELQLWFTENADKVPAACRKFQQKFEWRRTRDV